MSVLRRVVDYMRTTEYDDNKLATGRKTFYNWFTQYDKRSNSNLVETFRNLKNFMIHVNLRSKNLIVC